MKKRILPIILVFTMLLSVAVPMILSTSADGDTAPGGDFSTGSATNSSMLGFIDAAEGSDITIGDGVVFDNNSVSEDNSIDDTSVEEFNPNSQDVDPLDRGFTEAEQFVNSADNLEEQIEESEGAYRAPYECSCEYTPPERLSLHADACTRKNYVKDMIAKLSGEKIFELWKQNDVEMRRDILDMTKTYYATRYTVLWDLICNMPKVQEQTVNGVTISVDGAPEDVALVVADMNEWQEKYYESVGTVCIGGANGYREFSFDLSFYGANGEEWQPTKGEPVSVTIDVSTYDFHEGQLIGIIHEHEGVESDMGCYPVQNNTLTIETDSFSEFQGFIVEFEYNGKWYFEGNRDLELSALLNKLEMNLTTSEIESVKFTDSELITIHYIEASEEGGEPHNWRMYFKKAFSTHELLTLTLYSGEEIVINVYDKNETAPTFTGTVNLYNLDATDADYDYIITKSMTITTYVTVNCWPTHKASGTYLSGTNGQSHLRILFKYGVYVEAGGNLNFTDVHDTTHATNMWGHTQLVRNDGLAAFFTLYRGGTLTINGHNSYAMEINGACQYSENVTADTGAVIRIDNTTDGTTKDDTAAASKLNIYDVQFVNNHTLGSRGSIIQVSSGEVACKTRYNIVMQRCAVINSYSVTGSIVLLHNNTAGTARFEWCIFAHNVSSGYLNKVSDAGSSYGGGIRTYGRAAAQITLNQCLFYKNKTGYIRKLTVNSDNKITAVNDTENTTDTCMGAAVYFNAGAEDTIVTSNLLTIKDCQFIGNQSNTAGGAIYTESRVVFESNTHVGTNYNYVKHPCASDTYKPYSGYQSAFSSSYLARNPENITNSLYSFLRGTYITENVATAKTNSSTSAAHIRGLGGGIAQATYSNTGVTVYTDNTLTMSDGVCLQANSAVNGGGFGMVVRESDSFPVGKAFSFTCNGATIKGNTATKDGGGIYISCRTVNYPTTLYISDGAITGNTANSDGGGIYFENTTDDIDITTLMFLNGNVSNNTAEDWGGGIYTSNATMNIGTGTGHTITINDNEAKGTGGGIFAHHSNMMIGTGGTNTINITNNTAKHRGGGVAVYQTNTNSYTFVLANGNISNNTTTSAQTTLPKNAYGGGGIWVHQLNDSTTTLSGGTVSNNTTANLGGGVYAYSGGNSRFVLDGGTISSNTSSKDGGGIYIHNDGTGKATISGGTISGNTATNNGGGVYMRLLGSGTADISGGTISGNTANATDASTEENIVRPDGGGGVFIHFVDFIDSTTVTTTANCKVTISDGLIQSNNSKLNGGGVCVYSSPGTGTNGNVLITGGTVKDNTTEKDGGGISMISSKVVFEGGTVSGNTATRHGGGIMLESGSHLTLNQGQIISNTATENGGGICNSYTVNTLIINGGTIEENISHQNGGGVYSSSGSVTISQGTINNNTTHGWGGGIYVTVDGNVTTSTLTMTGGSITNNHAIEDLHSCGGGISVREKATMTLSAGVVISGNDAALYGGGINLRENATLTMTGGEIYNNTASHGGGIYVSAANADTTLTLANLTLNNGDVYQNTAEYGGGMYIRDGAQLGFSGGEIHHNHATLNGGGVYANSGAVLNMQGGTISYNRAGTEGNNTDTVGYGGGINAIDNSVINIKNGYINNNIANWGGGAFIKTTTFTMTGGQITYNNALNGAGLELSTNAVATISNGNIDYNGLDGNCYRGGGIAVLSGSQLEISGDGSISYNMATRSGGGIYIAGGTTGEGGKVDMLGGLIRYNRAEGDFNTVNNTSALPADVPTKDGKPTSLGYADSPINGMGIGGGVYLETGNFYMQADTNSETASTVGIYGNLATFAADDVYASGVGTDVVLPDITGMELTGLEGTEVTGWYMDYIPNDGNYPTTLVVSPGGADRNQGRYRTTTNVDQKVNYPGAGITGNNGKMYLNLTLGSSANMTITKTIPGTSEKPDSDFIYKITLPNNAGIMYVTLTSGMFEPDGNGNMVASVTVTHVVEGEYTIEELQSWSWRYNCTDSNTTNDKETVQSQNKNVLTFTLAKKGEDLYFVNTRDKQYWLDGINSKRNWFDKF